MLRFLLTKKKKKSKYDKIKETCTKITNRNRNHHFSIWSFTPVSKSNIYFLLPFKTIHHLIFNILSLSNIFYFPKTGFLRLFRTLIIFETYNFIEFIAIKFVFLWSIHFDFFLFVFFSFVSPQDHISLNLTQVSLYLHTQSYMHFYFCKLY